MVNQNRPLSPAANTSINTSSSSSSTNNANQQSLVYPSSHSATKNFSDNFWGDKATGFDVLCQNLKHSLGSVKDLEQFLREASSVEDQYARSVNKLVSVINKSSTNGSFHPTWSLLRDLNERYSATHANMVQSMHELIRDVQKYADDLSKKIKRIRENEQQTQLVVQSFQECSGSLNKAKDQYHNLCAEFDKLRRQLDPQQLAQYQTMSQQQQQQISTSNLMSLVPGANSTGLNSTLTTSRVSQLIKVEKKMKQSCDDYKSSIEKYNMIRLDYERKLIDSCNQFQYAEEIHLKQMKGYVDAYSNIMSSSNLQKGQIMADLAAKMENFSCDYLISLFVDNKRTGIERPEVAQFVDSPVNTPNVTSASNLNDNDYVLNENEFKNFFQSSYSQLNADKTQSPVQNNESKKNDSKGLNIFNVDFLTGRNRNKKSHNKNQKSSKQAQTKTAQSGAVSAPVPAPAHQPDDIKTSEEKSLNSLSLDLLDHLKISDVDSEGYSLRPDSSIDLRRRTNDDMNNYVSSPSSSESDSDSDEQPVKVMLKINPKKDDETKAQNMDVLREISKNLQLQKPPSKIVKQSKTYQYNYNANESSNMTRSVSMGSNLQAESLNKTESSLFDIDFSPKTKIPNENSLYNIDEDKEVESSFQYNLAIKKAAVSSSPAGRFTPACFPGRTTPDFRHTTSLFEQQSTRASIISPLTVNAGSEIVPIAIAFNETIHAYFKIGESSKFKIKCFGCMKVSFPYAILKLLPLELPQLEFNLKNLNILNQDLKLNTQLLEKNDSLFTDMDEFNFRFRTQNLVNELKNQHQMNKMAAFFNFELLKYEFRYLKEEAPLVLEAKWSSNYDEQTVHLELEYRLTCAKSLSQCSFMVLMPMAVRPAEAREFRVELDSSEPAALSNRQEKEARTQVLFQLGNVNASGKVSAKFRVCENGGEKLASLEQLYQPVYAKFHIDNDTLSSVKFKITSANYKLSLLKEKVESGKYFCDYDPQQSVAVQKTRSQITAGSISTLIGSTVDLLN